MSWGYQGCYCYYSYLTHIRYYFHFHHRNRLPLPRKQALRLLLEGYPNRHEMRMRNDKFNLNGSIVDGYMALTT